MNLGTLIVALLFVVLGIVIRLGKANWLIAGYNTSSKGEKAKYDEKALCRFVSNLLFVLAAIEILIGFAYYLNLVSVVVIGYILMVAVVIGSVIYLNTGNRYKNLKQ